MKRLSIITINFNNKGGLERTTKSFESLPCSDFGIEHVFIDGGSSDGSMSVIREFSCLKNNCVVVSESDNGIFDAMNKGIQLSSYEYVLFMNSGDCIVPETLSKFVECDLNIFSTKYISNDRKWTKKVGKLNTNWGLPFCHQSVIVKRQLHIDRPFDTKTLYADLTFFGELLKRSIEIKVHDDVLAEYEVGGVSDITSWSQLVDFSMANFRVNRFWSIPAIGYLGLRVIKHFVTGRFT